MESNVPDPSEYQTRDLAELQMAVHQIGVEVHGRYMHDPENITEIRAALGLAFSALLVINSDKACMPREQHRMSKCVPKYFEGEQKR